MAQRLIADPNAMLHLVVVLAALGVLMQSFELWSLQDKLLDHEIYSWPILKRRWQWTTQDNALTRLLDLILNYPNIRYLLGSRVMACLFLILLNHVSWISLLLVSYIYLTTILLLNSRRFGPMDAGDSMLAILFGVLFLANIGGKTPLVIEASLWFLALQVCLSYFANGVVKLRSSEWRHGDAFTMVANHQLFGNWRVVRFLVAWPRLSRFLTWSVIAVEILFPLVLVADPPTLWLFLGWGILFHSLNARISGLTSFICSFPATYPAIIYVSFQVQAMLYG